MKNKHQTATLALKDVSSTITAITVASGQRWPFMILDDLESIARANKALSNNAMITIWTVVLDEQRQEYEDMYLSNIDWYYKSAEEAGIPPGDELSPHILSYNGTNFDQVLIAPPRELYMVLTQTSPPLSNISRQYNLDADFILRPRWNYMDQTKEGSRGNLVPLFTSRERGTEDLSLPFYQPVFQNFSDEKEMGAMLWADITVIQQFSNILNLDTPLVYAVLENTCDNFYTYGLNGPEAVFIGSGDLHEEEFDDLKLRDGLSLTLEQLQQGEFSVANGGSSCDYILNVYPSSEFRSSYDSSDPVVYTVVVVMIFVFTSTIFVLYDILVQRRQETVMSSALETEAIVSSMFPAQFREKMLENDRKSGRTGANQTKDQLRNFLGGGSGVSFSTPVADLFPEATVMVSHCSNMDQPLILFIFFSSPISQGSPPGVRRENLLKFSRCLNISTVLLT